MPDPEAPVVETTAPETAESPPASDTPDVPFAGQAAAVSEPPSNAPPTETATAAAEPEKNQPANGKVRDIQLETLERLRMESKDRAALYAVITINTAVDMSAAARELAMKCLGDFKTFCQEMQ